MIRKVFLKETAVARKFDIHFQSMTSSLGLLKWPDSSKSLNEPDTIKSIISKYKNHHGIKKIKGKYITGNPFSFRPVTPTNILDIISTVNDAKSSGRGIPLRTFQDSKIFPQSLCKWIKDSIKTGAFPDPIKLVVITPIRKKEDPFDRDNYQPINILPLTSEVFEKIMHS